MYPALAVLQTLDATATDILWVGAQGGVEEELVTRAGLTFRSIPAAGVHGVSLNKLPGNIWQLVRGFFAAGEIIRQFKPDVLFFTGGYVAVPVALAGLRIPSVGFVPDIEPALAMKVVCRFATQIAVIIEASRQFYPEKAPLQVTGYPIREELRKTDRHLAINHFQFRSDLPVLLVTGGSLGARSINKAIMAALPELLQSMQVIHITGNTTWEEFAPQRAALDDRLRQHYRPYPYLHSEEIAQAFSIANLVVSRAGASSLGEYPYYGLPAILVPYPHAWRYQKENAQALAERGAATVLRDEDLERDLLPVILNLMKDHQKTRDMSQAMKALSKPHAAEEIAALFDQAQKIKTGLS